METKKARKQIRKLYLLDGMGGMMIAGVSWVALLAARGFSTVEIGFAESIFHVASLIFEVPSGALADVFGRKKAMIYSNVVCLISSMLMILSKSFLGVAITMIFSALSYNLASGSREALAYDSLKGAGIEAEYDKFASNDLVIYEISTSLGTLLVGVALMLGYRKAYLIDAVLAVLCVLLANTFYEEKTELQREKGVAERFREVTAESVAFLRANRRARIIILFNATVGAVATLILFFLQAKLPQLGLPSIWLGPALFGMGLGSAVGAKAIALFSKVRYRMVGMLSLCGVLLAFGSIFTGEVLPILIGGFIGAFSDSFIEVRSDVVLNTMVPSNQRATLMSINSFTFSVVMMVLSPIFGLLFA